MSKEKDREMRVKIASKLKKAVKNPKKEAKRFEERSDLEKLYLYTIIVEQPVANTVIKLLQNLGSSAQFIHNGRGTAPSEVIGMLNANEDRKAVINAFVSEDHLATIQEEMSIFFKVGRKNRGVAFAVPFSSIQGIRMYKYLTQTF